MCKQHHINPHWNNIPEDVMPKSETGMLYGQRRFLKRCGGTNCTSWSIRTVNLLLFTSVVQKINLQAGKLPGSWHLSWLSAETKPQQWRWVFPVLCTDKKKNTFLHISLRHQRKVLFKSVISALPFFPESSPWNALYNSIQISRMVCLLRLHSKCHINTTLAVTVNWLPGPGEAFQEFFHSSSQKLQQHQGLSRRQATRRAHLPSHHSFGTYIQFRNRTVTHTELLDCFYLILVSDALV